ncbi:hypothetical protein [Mycobacterium sp. 155]|uniref:hypothetical protein n=1 Tax=Mycobacterium sp. 155 TaxID=1157943 RepID=UPI0018DEDA5E|nr:hypothetical protein [Mycobacterium sp. 155]
MLPARIRDRLRTVGVAAEAVPHVRDVVAPDVFEAVLEAGAQGPQLLAAYLAAMDLDFYVDPNDAPDLAAEITKLAARYTATTHDPTSRSRQTNVDVHSQG